MAKKRIDKERDSTSSQRILKAGKAALAIGAGAVFLSKTGLSRKLVSEVVPAVLDTKKTFSKELMGKKTTATNLYNAYNRSIGKNGEVFKKTLTNNKNIKYKPRTSDTKNLFGKIKTN